MKKRLLRVACLLLAALLLLPLSACSYPGKDLTVYREDGSAVSLSDFRGRPMVVCFWASWSRDAVSFLEDFATMYAFYGERVAFLAVNLTDGAAETKESAMALISQKGYTFPVYFDTDNKATFTFELKRAPALLFATREGKQVYFYHSALAAESFQAAILDILSL